VKTYVHDTGSRLYPSRDAAQRREYWQRTARVRVCGGAGKGTVAINGLAPAGRWFCVAYRTSNTAKDAGAQRHARAGQRRAPVRDNQIGLVAKPTAKLDPQRIRYSGNRSFTKPEDMPITKLTPEIITAAILGYEEQKRHIDSQIGTLKAMLSGGPTETAAATPEATPRKRKKFSAATRRRMREAQRRRFAKIKSESEPLMPVATPEPPKPKHRISAEGMKRILAGNKKRWALKRAEAAKKSAPKKVAGKKAAAG